MGLVNNPPAELMEFCFMLSNSGGTPLEFMKRPVVELEMWLKAMNSYYEKVKARKEGGD